MINKKDILICSALLILLVIILFINNNFSLAPIPVENTTVFNEAPSNIPPILSENSPDGNYTAVFYKVQGDSLSNDTHIVEVICDGKAQTVFKAEIYHSDRLFIKWKSNNTLEIGGGFTIDVAGKSYDFGDNDVVLKTDPFREIQVNSMELNVEKEVFIWTRLQNNMSSLRHLFALPVIICIGSLIVLFMHSKRKELLDKEGYIVDKSSSSTIGRYFFLDKSPCGCKNTMKLFAVTGILVHLVVFINIVIHLLTLKRFELVYPAECFSFISILFSLLLFIICFVYTWCAASSASKNTMTAK